MNIDIFNTKVFKDSKNLIIPVNSNNLQDIYSIIPELQELLPLQKFSAKKGEIITFNSLSGYTKVILIGLGNEDSLYKNSYESMTIGGKLVKALNKNDTEVSIVLTHIKDEKIVKHLAFCLGSGLCLKAYRFTKYFTQEKSKPYYLEKLHTVNLVTNEVNLEKEIEYSKALVSGIYLARDLVIEPANYMNSEAFVQNAYELRKLGVEVEVLDQKELEKLGMGCLLAVNQASKNEAKIVIMKWNGGGDSQPLAFVGKGVTFDSGGLSLKPSGAMTDMKGDMAGGATIAGLFKTLAMRKAKVNVIGLVGLVENMVSSNSLRPGDVVKSYSGKTVEVLNTDAEGRLVLADVLSYTHEKYNPRILINLATLTGAIIITLGYLRAGLFSNSEELTEKLLKSGELSCDKLWNLPVTDEYRSMMRSDIADICNISNIDRAAGSVTAAIFLKEFVENKNWAHIDIAGVSWLPAETDLNGKGASGFGVRLLDTLIAKYYENK